jgi:peptidoglycan/xylan/chitin deacetylase (PgdA/CDA1 family)
MSVATNASLALVFECGEEAPPAYGILEALAKSGTHATFFVDGLWAESNADVLRAIASAGHEFGSHGHGHPDWTAQSEETIRENLALVERIVMEATHRSTRPWVLPPKGAIDERVARFLTSEGLRYVDLAPLDGGNYGPPTREGVRQRAIDAAADGAVMLVHTGRWPTTQAVGDLVNELPARGYRLTTLTALGREPIYPGR